MLKGSWDVVTEVTNEVATTMITNYTRSPN